MGLATRVLAATFLLSLSACNCSQRLVGTSTDLTVEPAELNFGTRASGTTAALPVEVRNRGKVPANVTSLRIEADARAAFSTPATPFALSPGDAFQLTVAYAAPAAPGADTATLFLTSDTGAELAVALQAVSSADCAATNSCTLECAPRTCGAACGPTDDGCGHTLDCPPCAAPDAGLPDAGATPDAGSCAKTSCQAANAACGAIPDGCGGTLNCGACTNGAACQQNQCVCAAGTTESCADGVDNNCDGNVDCADPQCAGLAACAQPACGVTDPELQLTSQDGAMPAITWTGSGYAVFYADSQLRYGFARLDANFALGFPGTLTPVSTAAHRPFPAFDGTGFGLGWSDVRNGALQYSNEVFFNRFDAANGNTAAVQDLAISTGPGMAFPGMTGYSPALNEYGVLYADEGPSGGGNGTQRRMYLQRVGLTGQKLGAPTRVSPASLTDGAGDFGGLTWAGSNWGAVWTESRNGQGPHIYFNRLDPSGAPTPNELQLSTGASLAFLPRIASSGASFGATWSDQRGAPTQHGIWFQRLDASGAGASTPRLVTPLTNATFGYSDLVWTGAHWAVVYDDARSNLRRIYYARLDVDGNRLGPDQLISCQSVPAWGPTVTFDGARLAVAWSYQQNGVHRVWAKRFSP